jgi:nitrilase
MKDIKVAVVQDAPVLFDLNKTIDKFEVLIKQACTENPDLVLFPEAFVSAYPSGISFGTVVGSRTSEGRQVWQRYYDSALDLASAEFDRLSRIIKQASVFCVIGVIEKVRSGTLYCTLLYFNPKGELIGKHRKLKPTAAERIVWGEGDGSDLEVYDTVLGKIGGLICWENYMPLARTWLYQNEIEIYLAPTADARERWQSSMKHIAAEGRCFVLGCNQFVTKEDYPTDLPGEHVEGLNDVMSTGGSVIIDPLGNELAGPLWNESGILFAELKSDKLIQSKMDFDVVGHYSRNDVFELNKRR